MLKRSKKNKQETKKVKPLFGTKGLVFSGLVAGTGLGGFLHFLFGEKNVVIGMGIGAIVGFIICYVIGQLIHRSPEYTRMKVHYTVAGLLPGFMIVGNPYVIKASWGGPVGAVLFGLCFGYLLAPFMNRMKRRNKYLSFPGEGSLFTIFGFVMSYVGDEIAQLIIHTNMFYTPKKIADTVNKQIVTIHIAKHGFGFTLSKVLIGFSIPTLIVLLTFLWIGFTLAANRKRPAFGSVLTIIGGCMVAYLGIKVAPMLFVPGSGLMWAGLICGLLMIAMSLTAFYYSQLRAPLGVVIIVLSILSYIGAAGGLIIGGILGIFGGSLIAAWNGNPNENQNSDSNNVPPSITPEQNFSV